MNKNIFIFLLLNFFVAGNLFAQHRSDNWVFGFHCWLDFSSGIPIAHDSAMIGAEEACTSISDTSGNLLFYSNGHSVWNRHHQKMPHGDSLKVGLTLNSTFVDTMGTSLTQGVLTLPSPSNPNRTYYLIYLKSMPYESIYYSKIDMQANGGLGDVVQKNILFSNYSGFLTEKITAIKHANGRDWWLLTPNLYSDTLLVYLLSSVGGNDTILGPTYDTTGIYSPSDAGQITVSQEGDKIGYVTEWGGVFMYDFNRCSGAVSNPVIIKGNTFPNTLFSGVYYGCCFSPDESKFYLTHYGLDVWQIDLQTTGFPWYKVWDNPLPLDTLSGMNYNFCYGVGSLSYGPDNKIYASIFRGLSGIDMTYTYNHFLSVINNPNQLGALCDFQDSAISVGNGIMTLSLPTYINYNLGKIPDSPCDTLTSIQNESQKINEIINIYPNPSSNTINISSSTLSGKYSLKIYNLFGQQVKQQEIDFSFEGSSKVNIESLASGYYQLMLVNGSNVVSKRFVIADSGGKE